LAVVEVDGQNQLIDSGPESSCGFWQVGTSHKQANCYMEEWLKLQLNIRGRE
jgi:hypothetical protein